VERLIKETRTNRSVDRGKRSGQRVKGRVVPRMKENLVTSEATHGKKWKAGPGSRKERAKTLSKEKVKGRGASLCAPNFGGEGGPTDGLE